MNLSELIRDGMERGRYVELEAVLYYIRLGMDETVVDDVQEALMSLVADLQDGEHWREYSTTHSSFLEELPNARNSSRRDIENFERRI